MRDRRDRRLRSLPSRPLALVLAAAVIVSCAGPTRPSAGRGRATPAVGADAGDDAVPSSGDPGPPSPAAVAPSAGEDHWSDAFSIREGGGFGEQNIETVADPGGPHPAFLRVRYPKGSASPTVTDSEAAPVGGAQRYLIPASGVPADILSFRYWVRFPDGFDFVKGGKLPGLYGGTVNNGRRIPDGTNGFSTRYMWREGGAGEVYAYLPTSQSHGTSLGRGSWHFTTGRWHKIEQRLVLNTPGRPDGRVTVWFDGAQVLDDQRLEFRSTAALRIEGVLFSTFFGGSDASWASTADTHADFADLAVSP